MNEIYDDVETMLKLKYERRLIKDVSTIFEDYAEKSAVFYSCGRYGKKFKFKGLKRAYRLYNKGLKELDKKIPIFIELPKLEEISNGQYEEKKVNEENKTEKTIVISNLQEQVIEQQAKTKRLNK